LKPCDEVLATQIEEGYLQLKPFRVPATVTTKVPVPQSSDDKDQSSRTESPQLKPKDAIEQDDKPTRTASPFRFGRASTTTPVETARKEMIWKLLGEQHMGKYVVYTNATTAWLLSDDLYSKLTASVYQTLSAGVHLGGSKLVRGYVETNSKPQEKDKEPSDSKASTVIAKATEDEKTMESVADRVEEKEMEQDYDTSEKEDPTR
jgi:hypothetical protein